MAKLVLTVALMVLLAHASSAYRTTITTVEEVEDSSNSKHTRESCHLKAMRADLSACEQFIKRSRYGALALENPMDQKMRQCCDQLEEEMGDNCKCEGVKYVMQEMMDQEQGREMMQKMRKRAMQIPMSCGISSCHMPSALF